MRYAYSLTAIIAILLAVLTCATAADPLATPALVLVTTESRLETVTLVGVDAEANWTFKLADDNSQHVAPARTVVRWGSFAMAKGGHRAWLAAGGELVGYSVEITDGEVTLESDLLEVVKAPRDSLAAMIFDMPADAASAKALEKRVAAAPTDNDTLLFTNGDQLAGRLVGLAGNKLMLKTPDADFVVDRSRAAAVVLARTVDEKSPRAAGFTPALGPKRGQHELKTWIGLRDGSLFLADKLVIKDDRATVDLAAGTTISMKREAIVALQPIGGDAVYLSDRDDSGYRHIPFLALAWDYRRDRNVTGGPLVADGRLYLKGLGMHSASRITYNFDGAYRAFQSELAIDDSTGGLPRATWSGRGSVTCRVFVDDGSGKWQLKYESPVIRGRDKPVPVEVDLADAKRISLLVDYADRGDELDHVNWLDARVVK